MNFRCVIMLTSLGLLGACNSTGVGNPGVEELSLAITVDDQDDDGDNQDPDAGEAVASNSLPKKTVRHAILVLRELRWLPCDADQQPRITKGPFVVDLVARSSTPAIPPVRDLPTGGFCGIDAPLTAASVPPALLGRSLFFDGTRADGALFILYADMKATLRLRAKREQRWDDTLDKHTLLWAFRPRRWLQRRELDMADSIAWDGQMHAVVIDVDRHPLLYTAIRKRLAGESALYVDRESNGVLDQDDLEVGLGSDEAD